jgi:hypothetical protein
MAKLHDQVAAGAKRLVEEQSEARKQAAELHQELQKERFELSGGWNELETERKSIASSRNTESFLAALLKGGGAALAAILALAFAWLALYGLRSEDDSRAVCELLIEDLASERPLLSPDERPKLPSYGKRALDQLPWRPDESSPPSPSLEEN